MCGIAGVAGFRDRDLASEAVGQMVQALQRRGPDGEGIEVWNKAVLGHRRLAIFDLSDAGRQPMVSPDGEVGIVFNGAIYNFRELRLELEALNYTFRSNTDTEVLIHGYDAWGLEALVGRLRGMFAFGLWDDRSSTLFLVRDRLGVKPLCYAARNGQIAFASTATALRRAGLAGELDDQAVVEYLEFGYVTDARSIYQGIVKVPAATIIQWSRGEIQALEYWEPAKETLSPALSFDKAVERAEELFLAAVEKRLFADVPVGALLSGGVDSSLVCWAIAQLGGNITAYTVGTPGDPWDETADARATAERLGIPHEILDLTPGEQPEIDDLVTAYPEPFACASALGMLTVSRAVANSATVLLTGDGGDDVFLGYPEHKHLWLAQRFARGTPDFLANSWVANQGIVPRYGPLKRACSFLSYATGGLGAVAAAHDGLPAYQSMGLLGDRLASATVAQRRIQRSPKSARNVLEEFLTYDRQTRFAGEYMTKVDGATMYYSLEARSPFLDQDLWEFAGRLPFALRLRHGRLKAVLRELARRKIGDRVARGRKRGFGVPVQRWLVGRWRSAVEESLRGGVLETEGLINVPNVLEQLNQAARTGSAPNQLWYLFVLEKWLQHQKSVLSAHQPTAAGMALLGSG